MNILHLDSSALGQASASRELSAAIVASLDPRGRAVVTYRDLDAEPIPHLTAQSLARSQPDEVALAQRVLEEFLAAEVIVIGAPMYNFSIPSTLKAWIDRIAVAGVTFRYTAQGPQGLVGGKRVIVASARGGVHGNGASDHQENYLRTVFGFLGITEVEFIRAEGLALGPERRGQALSAAHAQLLPRAA